MNSRKLPKTLDKQMSDSCLIKKPSFSQSISYKNDPFQRIKTKFEKTPALKPTCHRILPTQSSFYISNQLEKNANHSRHNLNLQSIIFKPNIMDKIVNPSFTEPNKGSMRKLTSFKQIKSIFRAAPKIPHEKCLQTEKNRIIPVDRRAMRRVNSLIFNHDKKYREKSSLDFSFGDPD